MASEDLKRAAGEFAVDFVNSGMIVGLGEGTTAVWAIRRLAQKLRDGALTHILGIPSSNNVERIARELGLPLTTLEQHPLIDLTIDGADEVDPQFNLIKGAGGALLREKIVAQATRREIIVVTEEKLSPNLGMKWAVPVEVLQFGLGSQKAFLQSLGAQVSLRIKDGLPFVTDSGNHILDCSFGRITDPAALAQQLGTRAGLLEHGLFIALTHDLVIASASGVRHLATSKPANAS